MLVLANIKSLDSYSHHLIWNVWILKGYSIRNNINSNVGTMCDAFDHKCILNYRFQNGQNLGISFPQETFAADSFLLYVYFFIFDRAHLDFCTLITFNYRLLFRVYEFGVLGFYFLRSRHFFPCKQVWTTGPDRLVSFGGAFKHPVIFIWSILDHSWLI